MSQWPSTKASKVLKALLRKGYSIKVRKGSSHIQLQHPTLGEYTWAFHDAVEIGPVMLKRIAKKTNLKPEDL